MSAYHSYPDAMMRELPGYVSEEAPAGALPEEMHKVFQSFLTKSAFSAFSHMACGVTSQIKVVRLSYTSKEMTKDVLTHQA